MDEWLRYSYALLLETWQRDAVPDLLAGRAVKFTIHAVMNESLKFECGRYFKDGNWPPPPATRRNSSES